MNIFNMENRGISYSIYRGNILTTFTRDNTNNTYKCLLY